MAKLNVIAKNGHKCPRCNRTIGYFGNDKGEKFDPPCPNGRR